MGDYGIKITKGEKDVTSTDPRDYILWSKYPILKVYDELDSTFVSTAANVGILIINHGLGYNPEVLFYFQRTIGVPTDSGRRIVRSNHDVTTSSVTIENDPADKNNIFVTFPYPGVGSYTYEYHYYIFHDQAVNT